MNKRTTNTANEKATGVQPDGSSNHTTDTNHFILKSTATEAQYERLVTMLRTGEKNTFEFRRAGIMAPAARIKELNDERGYSIPRVDRRDLWDEWGFKHPRVAVYALFSEPEQGATPC